MTSIEIFEELIELEFIALKFSLKRNSQKGASPKPFYPLREGEVVVIPPDPNMFNKQIDDEQCLMRIKNLYKSGIKLNELFHRPPEEDATFNHRNHNNRLIYLANYLIEFYNRYFSRNAEFIRGSQKAELDNLVKYLYELRQVSQDEVEAYLGQFESSNQMSLEEFNKACNILDWLNAQKGQKAMTEDERNLQGLKTALETKMPELTALSNQEGEYLYAATNAARAADNSGTGDDDDAYEHRDATITNVRGVIGVFHEHLQRFNAYGHLSEGWNLEQNVAEWNGIRYLLLDIR